VFERLLGIFEALLIGQVQGDLFDDQRTKFGASTNVGETAAILNGQVKQLAPNGVGGAEVFPSILAGRSKASNGGQGNCVVFAADEFQEFGHNRTFFFGDIVRNRQPVNEDLDKGFAIFTSGIG